MSKPLFRIRRLSSLAPLITPLLVAGMLTLTLAMPSAAQAASSAAAASPAQVRAVADFQALELLTAADVSISPGAAPTVSVRAEDRLLPLLETVVEDRSGTATLVVRWKAGTRNTGSTKVHLTVVVPSLRAVQVSGAGDVSLQGFSVPSMRLGVAGAGDITVQALTTDELQVRVAGSGDVRGSGSATKLSVSVAGSGDVQLADLRSEDARVQVAGSGDVAVQAQRSLDVSIVGSGDVVYSGNAKVSRKIVGSGSIRQR